MLKARGKTMTKVMKKVTQPVEELDKVFCNKCGAQIDEAIVKYEGFGQLDLSFGYGSCFDGDQYRGDLCDRCGELLIKTFKLTKK